MAARTLHVSVGTHLMSAPHSHSDDFEADIDLDSLGHRQRAMRGSGATRRVLGALDFRETVARIEVEGPKVL